MSTHAYPDGITKGATRPPTRWQVVRRFAGVAVFGTVVGLALLGAFGHERTWGASEAGVELRVHMPQVMRNGEFLELRISVTSTEPIGDLEVGIGQALWEDITINTLLPSAREERNEDGEFRFVFGSLAAGTPLLFKVDGQVNPDFLGSNDGVIAVYDGETRLASVSVSLRVLP